jgi:YebC/PmpR family DNA-binding regulatory protein
VYEGYGPHGIAVIVDTLTDNKNRTVADLRRMFSSCGGSLAENGAVSWMFNRLGVVRATGKVMSDDQLLELLLDFDIKDIDREEDVISVTCDPKSLDQVRQTMKDAGFTIETAELEWVASNSTPLDDEQAEKASEFLSELEDLDDVKNVYTNLGG